MARISYPDPRSLPQTHQDILNGLPNLNVFRMMAGAGEVFPPFMDFINAYLNNGLIDAQLRELIILRVGNISGSTYEVHQHERVARTEGLSEDRIAATRKPSPSAVYSDAENAALCMVEEIVANVRPSDATFQKAQTHFSEGQLQELTIIAGFYMMVSRYLETFDIELEEEEIEGSGLAEIRQVTEASSGNK